MNTMKLDFVQVPASALFELEGANLKVYAIIYTSCKMNDNKFYHSYQQFADECNLSLSGVKKAIRFLKDNEYIKVESGRGAKKPNIYNLLNSVPQYPINGILQCPINGVLQCPINGVLQCPQKEYIKEESKEFNNKESKLIKKESNESVSGKLNNEVEVKENLSISNLKSKDEDVTVQTSAIHTKDKATIQKSVVMVGDTPKVVEMRSIDYIFNSIPKGTPSKTKTQSNDNTSTAEATTEERNNNNPKENSNMETTHNPKNYAHPSIDDLEAQFNYCPNETAEAQTTNNTQSNNEGRKFTPRLEWDNAMDNIKTKIEEGRKLDQTDLKLINEGTNDAYRVIDVLKTIRMLLRNYARLNCYALFLNQCDVTIQTIQSEKQRKYADDILDECDKYYEHYNKVYPKAV